MRLVDFEQPSPAVLSQAQSVNVAQLILNGMTFELEGGGAPQLAETGGDCTAFWGPLNSTQADLPMPGENVGVRFITDDGIIAGNSVANLIVTYESAVGRVGGMILDIDYSEAWRIEARSALGTILDSMILDETSDHAGDGLATSWHFDRATNDIFSVRIAYIGTNFESRGFAWDNFMSDEVPPTVSNPAVPLPPAAWSILATMAGAGVIARGRKVAVRV